ncbi:unnamed protein product [Peronospora belbahrii]|uniref:Uncharacterized protein n=1 Tax=Peronospora belbahrii TaxID=622444 RepID=A0ABN8DAD4_9STRA|nr:unnamed protein product [Peronospora belbahrii]
MAQSMVFASRLPLKLWEDAAEYAAFILNRIIFGSICSVSRDPRTGSLKQRSAIGVIIGKFLAIEDQAAPPVTSSETVAKKIVEDKRKAKKHGREMHIARVQGQDAQKKSYFRRNRYKIQVL